VDDEADDVGWLAVIGRSLAFLCLAQADLRDKDLGTQGLFLEALGLKRQDTATMLGTTAKTLNEAFSRARKRQRGNHAKKKKHS